MRRKRRSDAQARRATADRRIQRRISVGLPMVVRGTDATGLRFEEYTQTHDVSRTGVAFLTSRRLKVGANVEIVISRLGARGDESEFGTLAHVIRIEPKDGKYLVGVHFLGPRFHRVFVHESTGEAG